MDLKEYLGETIIFEKKAMLEEKKPKSWLKSVSAFANGAGGVLIFGVNDEDILIGLRDVKMVSEKISEIMKARMDPIPLTSLEIHTEENKDFVLLRVFPGEETPYYYVGDGNRIAYIRIGNESVVANRIDLKRLVLHGISISYDSLVSRYRFESLSFTKLRSVYRMRTGMELLDSDFISFELMDENHMLTNAGVLLADDSPIRHSRLFCTRWYGLNKASGIMEAIDDKEFSGSLISLLQNGMEFVKNNTKKRWKKTVNGRVEMPEYIVQSVHEVLVNALIHRDYMEIGSEVHIDIFDDRMEVYSPGGMLDGSIVQDLDIDNISSKRRNPIIADMFSRMYFMERRGSGFKKIKKAYQDAFNFRDDLEPKFWSTGTSFFACLYNLNYQVPVEKMVVKEENVAFDSNYVAVEDENVVFDKRIEKMHANSLTIQKVKLLFNEFGFEKIFGRMDISNFTNESLTASGNLIGKLKSASLIEEVRGYGKGKYRFIK